jgi:hypothetical protein
MLSFTSARFAMSLIMNVAQLRADTTWVSNTMETLGYRHLARPGRTGGRQAILYTALIAMVKNRAEG